MKPSPTPILTFAFTESGSVRIIVKPSEDAEPMVFNGGSGDFMDALAECLNSKQRATIRSLLYAADALDSDSTGWGVRGHAAEAQMALACIRQAGLQRSVREHLFMAGMALGHLINATASGDEEGEQ